MKKLLLLAVVTLGFAFQSFAQTMVQPNDAKIQYFGRWDWSAGNPRCTWPSLYLKAKFTGTAIKAKFTNTFYNGSNLVNVVYSIDGAPIEYEDGVTEFTVSGLSSGQHEIMISRRCEANGADLTFNGFEITGGNLVDPNPRPCVKFEFVGNSITCGLSNENFDPTWDDGNGPWVSNGWEQNSYRSYAPVVSRLMDAEYRIESHSGQGMFINLNNSLPEAQASDEWELNAYYPGWAKTGWDSKYNFANDDFKADFFFTLLGTNDWSDNNYNQGLIDIAKYKARYKTFIDLVFSKYPNTTFFVVTPILDVRGWADGETAHQQIVSEMQAAGKDVHLIDLSQLLVQQTDFGNDWTHPTTKGHKIMADKIKAEMEKIPSVVAKLNSLKSNCNSDPIDCNGDLNGTAYLDDCQECVGGNTGKVSTCTIACDGVKDGTAFIDDCQECVGGTTGKTACTPDCNGDFGGTAYIDNCGDCVKGNTGLPDCEEKSCTRMEFEGEYDYLPKMTGSDNVTNTISNGSWVITANNSGVWDAATVEFLNPVDMTSAPDQKLWLRIKASGKALVVPSLSDVNGITTGNSSLSGWNSPTAEGKTSIETTTSWEEYTIDFSGAYNNEWGTGCPCPLDESQITKLFLSINPGYGTQWPPSYKDGTEITGGYTGTIEVDYMILGYDNCDMVGSNEIEATKSVNVYPNPAQDFVKVDIDDVNAEWTVINAMGTVVLKGKGTFVPTETFSSGLYFITENNGKWNAKFMKK